jgi:hypothetical protein
MKMHHVVVEAVATDFGALSCEIVVRHKVSPNIERISCADGRMTYDLPAV